MRFSTLADWLDWQQSLNPKTIDLGLQRVAEVLQQLQLSADFPCPVITLAGTNGKGSTAALLESILSESGLKVGCYTSPHILAYNERVRLQQQPVSEQMLCEAFDAIEQARGALPLTYFEFGTLAALLIFAQQQVDVAVLEVGLGGRLDAVNVVDADVAVITSIDIDHVDWLGADRESIAREKAGIMRAARPAVIAFDDPPASLLQQADTLGVKLIRKGCDYQFSALPDTGWQLQSAGLELQSLPAPALQGEFQLQNAAAAILAIEALRAKAGHILDVVTPQTIARGLQRVKLPGRFQQLVQQPAVWVDVAHNQQSAQVLAQLLQQTAPASANTIAVVAMLADKAVHEVLQVMQPVVDSWCSGGLDVARGLPAKNMAQAVRELHAGVRLSACETVAEACAQALEQATENDRIIVFGSFYTVAEATAFFTTEHDELAQGTDW
jgi:dihydrofolate synthase/folylpolyglutamate synthase